MKGDRVKFKATDAHPGTVGWNVLPDFTVYLFGQGAAQVRGDHGRRRSDIYICI